MTDPNSVKSWLLYLIKAEGWYVVDEDILFQIIEC